MQRELPPSPPAHLGVFSAQAAFAHGWTPDVLRHAVRREWVVRLTRGLYVASSQWDGSTADDAKRRLMIRAVAATMAVKASVASHTSAALLATLPIWELPDRACITRPPRSTGDAECAHLHRATLPAEHVLDALEIPRTRTARTVLDIAREHGLDDAVVAGDDALHRGLTDPQRLLATAQLCADWPGIKRAVQVFELLDPRSESAIESISRLRLGSTSLPAPEPQVEVFDENGVFLGRLDFYWDEFGVGGEVDGKVKYRDRPDEVWWREKKRQEPMEDCGLLFVRWGRADLEDMDHLERRIARTLARGARRPYSDRAWIARPTEPRFPLMRNIGLRALPRETGLPGRGSAA